jgi:hypothetical protein
LRARDNAPVFRYAPTSAHRFTHLRNYTSRKDIAIDRRSPTGVAPDALPQYLLLYASPAEIPWEFQYALNATCCAGRLDLKGEALEHYLDALLNNWQASTPQINHAVVWAVDRGPGDITHLMRDAIAAKIFAALDGDEDLHGKVTFLDGRASETTSTQLIQKLAIERPALVVTTSHGQTGPVSDPNVMRAKLGLPIDQNGQPLDPDTLLASWQPDGAIWYAHACCSAGADSQTIFDGLVETGSAIDQVLKGVAALGATISPLPSALLGASSPLRAFVGHVEPTFDWTIRQPATGQHLTNNIVKALYNNLYAPKPVGLSFRDCYTPLGALSVEYDAAARAFNYGKNTQPQMLYCRLAARDLQSMVILGDPTAVLPPLTS